MPRHVPSRGFHPCSPPLACSSRDLSRRSRTTRTPLPLALQKQNTKPRAHDLPLSRPVYQHSLSSSSMRLRIGQRSSLAVRPSRRCQAYREEQACNVSASWSESTARSFLYSSVMSSSSADLPSTVCPARPGGMLDCRPSPVHHSIGFPWAVSSSTKLVIHASRSDCAHPRLCSVGAGLPSAAPAVVAAAAGVAGRDDSRLQAPARGLVAFALLRRNQVAQSPGSRSRQWMRRMYAHMRLMPGSRCRQWMMMRTYRLMHSYPRPSPVVGKRRSIVGGIGRCRRVPSPGALIRPRFFT